jgi:hypothetical protein
MSKVERSAKLFSADWLKYGALVLPRGPPKPHISKGYIFAGTILLQLANFLFTKVGNLVHTIGADFAE